MPAAPPVGRVERRLGNRARGRKGLRSTRRAPRGTDRVAGQRLDGSASMKLSHCWGRDDTHTPTLRPGPHGSADITGNARPEHDDPEKGFMTCWPGGEDSASRNSRQCGAGANVPSHEGRAASRASSVSPKATAALTSCRLTFVGRNLAQRSDRPSRTKRETSH